MTFPCKEELRLFEDVADLQTVLYHDSYDHYGVPYDDINLPKLREALKSLLDFYGKPEYQFKQEKWVNGKSVCFFIPIEHDEGHLSGLRVKISGTTDPKVAGGGYMTIRTRRELIASD